MNSFYELADSPTDVKDTPEPAQPTPPERSTANPHGMRGPHFKVAAETDEDGMPTPEDRSPPDHLGVRNLAKSYRKGKLVVPVLKGVDFHVEEGEFVAIVGQSGSGKSTLLHLMGTLDAPDEGEVWFAGQRIDDLPATQRDRLRNDAFGMIFQFYHLLPELSTLENVLMPRMIAENAIKYWLNRHSHRNRGEELVELVGLGHRLRHKPRELSGGEMQRAAIARALIAEPQVLLADEPTGNLDQQTGEEIMQLLRTLNAEQKLTIVMVTHDPAVAEQADRVVRLVEGRVVDQ